MYFANLTLNVRLLFGFGSMLILLGINTWLAASNTAGAARSWIVIGGIASIGVGAIIAWWLMRGLIHPLQKALAAAHKITGGDLTSNGADEQGGKASDEFGQLMLAFKTLRQHIFKVVSDVRTGTTTVAGTSSQISRDNSALSERTRMQASSLEATAASMEQLTVTVKQNAVSAEQANKLVVLASDQAVKGGEVVNQVVLTMGSIKDSSRKIVDIISVIDSIAFQTNILALNAAVEAARAGDQGRGFAVVAAEVRTLAKRSATAAKEIKSLIVHSVEKVDSGSKLVDDAGKTMDEIVSSVKRVAGIMRKISEESREQSTGIQTVNAAITQIDDMIKKNEALVREAGRTSTALNEYAVSLLKSVSGFNLGTSEYGNEDEAIALVKRGVEFAKTHGQKALLDEINKLGKSQFIDRDLYLMAIGANDVTYRAHGNNPRNLGLGPASVDVDGKRFVHEMCTVAKTAGSGWVEYKWAHPVTNEINVKSTYVEKCGEYVVACGVYKQ